MKKLVKITAAMMALSLCLGSASALAAEYTVVRGDSLWRIARQTLGSGRRWTELYQANQNAIKDPNHIYVGQRLTIPDDQPDAATPAVPTAGKAAVNFSGVVTEVNDGSVTLDCGKVVVIGPDTLFGGPGHEVGRDIAVDSFLQGYTADDPKGDQLTAVHIWTNRVPTFTPGRFQINYEGRIAAVDGDRVTLDNGKVVLLTGNTVFSIPKGVVPGLILTEGTYIQGYTTDDPEGTEFTAARVHVTPL